MNTSFFIVLLFLFSFVYLIIGIVASRRTKNTNDFFLAGRNLGFVPLTFSLIATQLGGGMLLGTAQQAYLVGLQGIMYTLGITIGFLLLGMGFASRLQSLNVATTAELFQTRYNAPLLKKCASILSILTLLGIVIGQMVAARTVFASVGITQPEIFIAFWLIVIAHTMLGGLAAVAVTDLYQVAYLALVFIGIFVYSIYQNPWSLAPLLQPGTATALPGSKLLSFLLMPALFSLIEQDLAQRFFAARNSRVAAGSALAASAFMLMFCLIPIYFGITARSFDLAIGSQVNPLLTVIGHITNQFVVACALCAIIAAISSTVDSLLCAISSNVAQDFDLSYIGLQKSLRSSQIITCIIGIVALAVSFKLNTQVIEILAGSYELSISCLFVPLLVSYFKPSLPASAAAASMAAGLLSFITFKLFIADYGFWREFASLAFSAISFFAVFCYYRLRSGKS